jgi:hypothetical protein
MITNKPTLLNNQPLNTFKDSGLKINPSLKLTNKPESLIVDTNEIGSEKFSRHTQVMQDTINIVNPAIQAERLFYLLI